MVEPDRGLLLRPDTPQENSAHQWLGRSADGHLISALKDLQTVAYVKHVSQQQHDAWPVDKAS